LPRGRAHWVNFYLLQIAIPFELEWQKFFQGDISRGGQVFIVGYTDPKGRASGATKFTYAE